MTEETQPKAEQVQSEPAKKEHWAIRGLKGVGWLIWQPLAVILAPVIAVGKVMPDLLTEQKPSAIAAYFVRGLTLVCGLMFYVAPKMSDIERTQEKEKNEAEYIAKSDDYRQDVDALKTKIVEYTQKYQVEVDAPQTNSIRRVFCKAVIERLKIEQKEPEKEVTQHIIRGKNAVAMLDAAVAELEQIYTTRYKVLEAGSATLLFNNEQQYGYKREGMLPDYR